MESGSIKKKKEPSSTRLKEMDRSADKIEKLERIPEIPNEFNLHMSSLDSLNSPDKQQHMDNNAYQDSDDLEERDQSMIEAARPQHSEQKNRQVEREPSQL